MSLMETRSGLRVGVGVGVGVGGNGSGNGNGKRNTHKRNVNGDSNQLTTHKGDQVVHKDLDMQEHYNFNEAINFNFQFTLPESLFQSEKKEQPQSTRRPHKVRSGEGRCMQPYPSTKRGHFQNFSIPKKEVENRRVEEDEEEDDDDDDDDDEEYTRRPHIVRSGKGRCMQPYPSTQRGYFQNFENDEQKSSDDEEESDDDDDDDNEEEEEYTRRPHIVRSGEGRPTQPYPTMQRGYSRNFGKDEEESSDDEEESDDDDKYTKLPHIVRSGEGRRTQPYPTTQRGSRNFGKDKEESSDNEEESSDDEEEEEDDEEEYSMLAYGFTERRQLVMVCL